MSKFDVADVHTIRVDCHLGYSVRRTTFELCDRSYTKPSYKKYTVSRNRKKEKNGDVSDTLYIRLLLFIGELLESIYPMRMKPWSTPARDIFYL